MESNKNTNSCCQLEAVVSFDDRGQLVLPKDIRKKFNLKSGEKFAIISCMNGDELCCLTLVKTQSLNDTMQNIIGPLMASE
jgi:AbrB family looped-hinge helix DNA binding protein